MAEHNDGSIIIDTELDNSGFDKGSDKLLNAVKDLTGAVDNLGDNMMQSFGQIIPLLSSIAGSAASVNAAMQAGATQTIDTNDALIDSEGRVAGAARQAAGTISAANGNVQTSASSLERQIHSINTSLEAVSRSAEIGFSSGNAVLAFDNKLSALETKLNETRTQLEAFGETKIPTEDYQWLTEHINKAQDALAKLQERQIMMEDTGVKKSSTAWQKLMYDIQQTKAMLEDYKGELAYLEESGEGFVKGSDTEEFARMQSEVDETASALDRNRALIDQEALAQARLNVQAAQEKVIRAETAAQKEAAMAELTAAQQELKDVADSMANTDTDPKEESISGWQRFGSVLKSVGSAAGKVISTLARISFKAISIGVKSVTDKLKSFISHSKKASLGANTLVKALTSLKTMLKTRIKRMFVSAIINSVKEGIHALAHFSSEFDQSMSNIRNGAKELSANLAVSLGSLIRTIEPIITRVLNAVSSAISYLNALIASLKGQSTVTVAKKQMDSYADSTEGAADAAKDLKNQVYGFDQLNKRNSDDNSGSSGADLYETVDIDNLLPEGLSSFFERIKEAFTDGDWTGLGGLVAEGLNTAFSAVDTWITNTLRPKAVEWSHNIAEILNGFVDKFDWNQLGETIANGVNTVFDTLNTFLTTFDFEKFGKSIGDAITGFFNKVDWDALGETFANKWNALIDFIFGLVSNVDWESIGKGLFNFVDSFINTLDLKKAIKAVGKFISGIVDAFHELIKDVDWESLARDIADGLNEINWAKLLTECISLITDIFNGIIDFIYNFIAKFDWVSVGRAIGNSLNNIVDKIDFSNIGKAISSIITGALKFAANLFKEIDIGKILADLLSGIGDIIANLDIGDILKGIVSLIANILAQIPGIILGAAEGIVNIIGGFFDMIGLDFIGDWFHDIADSIEDGRQWLTEKIRVPLTDALNGLLWGDDDTYSKSTVAEETIDRIKEKYESLTTSITTCSDTWSKAIQGIQSSLDKSTDEMDYLENLKKKLGDCVDENGRLLNEGYKPRVQFILDELNNAFGTEYQLIDGQIEQYKKMESEIDNLIERERIQIILTAEKEAYAIAIRNQAEYLTKLNEAQQEYDAVCERMNNSTNGVSEELQEEYNIVKTNLDNARALVDSSTAAIVRYETDATLALSGNAEDRKKILSRLGESYTENGVTVILSLKQQYENEKAHLESLKRLYKKGESDITQEMIDEQEKRVNEAQKAYSDNMKSAFSSLLSSAKEKIKSLIAKLKGETEESSSIGSNLVYGIQNGISNNWSGLNTTVSNLGSSLISGFKRVFGIQSPSKVFAEIGEYLDEGLGQGIERGQRDVLKTARNLAQNVTDSMDADMPTLEMSEDSVVYGLNVVSDRLAGIASTFKSIASVLTSIGGFKMPQIAAGTVVPVKTKIDPTTAPAGAYGLSTDFTEGVDEQLDDITTLLRQLIAVVKALHLDIDIDALTDMITQRQRSNVRNYGGAL